MSKDVLEIFERWIDPLPMLITPSYPKGIRFKISCPFGDKRTHPKTGLPTLHGGADRSLRRAKPGKIVKPNYFSKNWWAPSWNPKTKKPIGGFQVPILSSWDGQIVIAGVGKNKAGDPIMEIAIDHGKVEGIGPLRCEHVHCFELLVRRGQYVKRGEPVAIMGESGTDATHDHNEWWSDFAGDRDGIAERGEKIDPAPLLDRMLLATYNVDVNNPVFDPARLAIPA